MYATIMENMYIIHLFYFNLIISWISFSFLSTFVRAEKVGNYERHVWEGKDRRKSI